MEDIDRLFTAVAAGEREPPAEGIERMRLLRKVRSTVLDEDVERRRMAVEVGARIGGADGVEMVGWYARDPDPEIALEAIGRMRRLVDAAVTQGLKRQLGNPDARVRQAAADALGHVGGGSLVPVLRKTAEEGGEVGEAASQAVDRILGKLPKDDPDPWWEVVEPEPERLEFEGPIDLPEVLPDTTLGLYKVLGGVREEDRQVVLDALAPRGDLWDTALGQARPGLDATTFRGVCVAAVAFGRSDWIVTLRRRLPDPSAAVRQAVAQALGILGKGKPSLVMGLVDLLQDPVPEVRIAGAQAMGDLEVPACRGFLQRHAADPDPEVKAAIEAAMARY